MKKRVIEFIGYAALLYIALLGAMYMAQSNLIYVANSTRHSPDSLPIEGIEDIAVQTEDGHTLNGWYKAPKSQTMPTIIRFHGNASNVRWSMESMAPYIEQGYGALSAEYRGYSGNPGKPSEDGLYKDGRAYMQWLQSGGTLTNQIIIYGESVGSGPAVQMALEYPDVQRLILQSPFTSLVDAAAFHYPFFPVKWLLKDRYESLQKIKDIKTPVIIVHGTKDGIVPYKLGKKLFDAANEPKTLIAVEGAGHNDLGNYNMSEKILSALSE